VIKKLFPQGKLIIIAILLIGAFFRFSDLNWDQNEHLHPDERFLTMVGDSMKIPPTFADYLTPQLSTMNPANIGYSFYVYGTFPVVADKFLAIATGNNNYNSFTLLGRVLSGFVDLLIVAFIFKTGELFEKEYKLNKKVKYWMAFFYAIAVLPIQLSHFFAVDTFFNTFVFLSFYFALRFSFTRKLKWVFATGLFLGLAIASKATAVFIGPLLLYFFITPYTDKKKIAKNDLVPLFKNLLLMGAVTYIIGRIADPYLFQTGNFFDPQPSKLFLQNIKELEYWSNPKAWYPPGVQWIHKTPVLFALKNLVIYCVGIGYTLCVLLGIYFIFRKIRLAVFYIILSWVVMFFIYQGMQTVQTIRYFIIIYPFLAMFAGIGFAYIPKNVPTWIKVALMVLVVLWPMLFFSIYTKPITRVSASEWIYQHIPANSVLLTESWDDALPLPVPEVPNRNYISRQLPVFDPDTVQKWNTMDRLLSKGNYLILSSNRGYGSIPTVPERYPKMTKFYHDLFAGKTQYKEIAQFTSYPSLNYLGIPLTIPDDNAEEAFTVYDHPKVIIFKNEDN
jgi:Dolichyl-phosphate-mannose-protein mannosyltransferase